MENEERSLRVPAWCPQCSLPMKGKSTGTYYDWGVCITCFIEFIDGREERWRSGWRPDVEAMEMFNKKYG